MVGLFRGWALGLLAMTIGVAVYPARAADAQDADKERDAPKSGVPALLGDEPKGFVPKQPMTVEDRKRIEATQEYAEARALENRRQFPEAIARLEEALKKEPESIAIMRRLSRLCFALGRTEQAIKYSRKVIESDPNDTATLHRLVRYFELRNDADGAEQLLTQVVGNPKLDKATPAYLLAQHDLGMLYRAKMLMLGPKDKDHEANLKKAADAFAKLLDALDDKTVNQLSPSDLSRVLGAGPQAAATYFVLGATFLEAKRYDLAVRALQRGLVYKPGDAQLLLQLARAMLAAHQSARALEVAESFIKQQPQQREGYDLLVECLTELKRENEIIPRLEEASKANPQNRGVQYVLAERYTKAGQRDKANALYEQLRATPPNAQDFAALSTWLLKEKKTDELVKLLGEAIGMREGLQAVQPQIDMVIADPAYAQEMLDTALKMMEDDPPSLGNNSRRVLAHIAERIHKPEKVLPILRLAIKKDPSPQDYSDLHDILDAMGQFDEAGNVLQTLLDKYPTRKNPRLLVELGRSRLRAQKKDAALEAFKAAQALDANDPEVTYFLCVGLSAAGKDDEAIETARNELKRDPSNIDFNRLLGSMLVQAGRNDDAIAHYKSLIERFGNNDELTKVAHSGLSVIYVNMEDFTKGEQELEVIYKKEPDDAGINNDLGYLYADQGKNLEQAESMIRKALGEDPENYAYLDSLGWVLYKRGRVKEALTPLQKASALQGGMVDPTIQDHLGDVYFRLHEYGKARTAWEHAAKLASETRPPDKRLTEIRKKLESLKELESTPRTSTGANP